MRGLCFELKVFEFVVIFVDYFIVEFLKMKENELVNKFVRVRYVEGEFL